MLVVWSVLNTSRHRNRGEINEVQQHFGWESSRWSIPPVEACGLPWMAGTVSGAALRPKCASWVPMTKIVQRVLRHAKPHVTRERYIKAFDPAVMEAMQRMQVVVNSLQAWPADELTGM